jgi:hypothetical protein
VVTFVSLIAVNGKVNLKTFCCVQKVPLISKCSRITRRRGVQWQAIMSRNNENAAEVHTYDNRLVCDAEQINEIGISFGLVQSSILCDLFVRERESVYLCACMAVHACMHSRGGSHGD